MKRQGGSKYNQRKASPVKHRKDSSDDDDDNSDNSGLIKVDVNKISLGNKNSKKNSKNQRHHQDDDDDDEYE